MLSNMMNCLLISLAPVSYTHLKTSEPVIGAAVKVKGTTVGTTTNLDGEFILKASKGCLLYTSLPVRLRKAGRLER